MTSKIPLTVVPHPPKNSKPVSSKYPHSASPLNEIGIGSRTPTSGDIGNLRRRRLRPARALSNTTIDSPFSSATRSPVIEEVIGLDSKSATSVIRLPDDSELQREATSAESTSSRHGRPPLPVATNFTSNTKRIPEPPSIPPNRTVSAELEKLRARSGSLSGRSEKQYSARSQLRGFLAESPRYRDGGLQEASQPNLPAISRRDSIKSDNLNDSLLRRANSVGTANPPQIASSAAKQQLRTENSAASLASGGASSAASGKSSSSLASAATPARSSRRAAGGGAGAASNGTGGNSGGATVFTFSSPPKQRSVARPPRRMQPLAKLVPRDRTASGVGQVPASDAEQPPALLPSLPRDSSENPLGSARDNPAAAATAKEEANRPKAQHQALFGLVTTEGPGGTNSPRNLKARVLKNHLREIHPTPAKAQLNRPATGTGATSAGPRGDSGEVLSPAQPASPAKATSAGSNAARASAANLRPALASRLSPRHAASQRRAPPLLLAPPQQPLVHVDLHSEAPNSTRSEERDRDESAGTDAPLASGLLMPAVRTNPNQAAVAAAADAAASPMSMPTQQPIAANGGGGGGGRQALDLGQYHMAELSDSFEERMLRSLQREQEEELSDLEEHEIRQHNDAVRQRAAAAARPQLLPLPVAVPVPAQVPARVPMPVPMHAAVPTVISGVPIPDLNIQVRFSTDTEHSLDSDSEAHSRRANFNGSSILTPDAQTLTRSQHYLEEMRAVLSGWHYRSNSPSQDVEDIITTNSGGFAGASSSPVRFTHQRPTGTGAHASLLRAQSNAQEAAQTAAGDYPMQQLQPLSRSQSQIQVPLGGGGGEELDLVYDACLNCYYDPRTMKYYEIV